MSDNATTDNEPTRSGDAPGQAARSGLDVMLSERACRRAAAAVHRPGLGGQGGGRAGPAPRAGHRPRRAASTAELARTAAGRSELAPAKGDRRFADPAWEGNWLLRRVLQGYLAVGETVDGLITDADVDWRAERRARLAAGNVLDALAPTQLRRGRIRP